jgi:hypothetical protein
MLSFRSDDTFMEGTVSRPRPGNEKVNETLDSWEE